MRKRFLAVTAAALLSISLLAGCGGKTEAPAADAKTEAPAKSEEKKEEAPKAEEKAAPASKNASPTAAAGAADDAEVTYVDGYYANNGESDMMLAFFEVGDVDVAYATDGEYEFWSQYTVEQATTSDGTEYLLVSFTDAQAALGYIDNGDGEYYLVDEDGNVYAAAQLTEEEANQLYDAVQNNAGAETSEGEGAEAEGGEAAVVDTSDITYVDGYYANDGNGNDFIIAFYETPNGDVAYVNDGTDEVLAEYTVEDATTADGVDYALVTVGNLKMGYVADDENVLIITEDDEVYAAAPLEESEAEAIVAAVNQ